jgi:hypothetical protein
LFTTGIRSGFAVSGRLDLLQQLLQLGFAQLVIADKM